MRFDQQSAAQAGAIAGLNDLYLADEAQLVSELAAAADPGDAQRKKILETAAQLVRSVRQNTSKERF